MVCKARQVRMAALVRLLRNGSHTNTTSEETMHEKITLQTINREICEANEANFLEEEDMHVFDSLPLKDPLHLVCCNACKKPIKASQYASHAERCRVPNPAEDTIVELDGDAESKKPPRKGRKKLEPVLHNQLTPNGEQEKAEPIDGNIAAASDLILDDARRIIYCTDKEGKDVPAPLATKLYYSQGSHRLRAAIAHLYNESVAKDGSGVPNPELVQNNVMILSQAPLAKFLHETPKDRAPYKNDILAGYASATHPDQVLAQTSDSCFVASGGYPSNYASPNQFHESNFPGNGLPAGNASLGAMRTKYHASPHSLPGNSGTGSAPGKVKQQNGSVPVG